MNPWREGVDAGGLMACGGSGDRVMDRRAFIGALAGGLLAAPLAAEAQPAGRVARIGATVGTDAFYEAFVQGLVESGWVPITAFCPILESDPIGSGFVATLARPGGNVTGIFLDLPELSGKQLQFLRDAVPGLARVGVMWEQEVGEPQLRATAAAARMIGITLNALGVRRDERSGRPWSARLALAPRRWSCSHLRCS